MAAYEHRVLAQVRGQLVPIPSHAGEFMFGGVTRSLLRACEVSLVMAD